MKKLFSILLVFVLCMNLSISSSAEELTFNLVNPPSETRLGEGGVCLINYPITMLDANKNPYTAGFYYECKHIMHSGKDYPDIPAGYENLCAYIWVDCGEVGYNNGTYWPIYEIYHGDLPDEAYTLTSKTKETNYHNYVYQFSLTYNGITYDQCNCIFDETGISMSDQTSVKFLIGVTSIVPEGYSDAYITINGEMLDANGNIVANPNQQIRLDWTDCE